MFKTPELARLAAERGRDPGFDPMQGLGRPEPASAFLADGFFSAFDDPMVPPREPGPGDSNYELTFDLRDAGDDPDADWEPDTEEFDPEAPSSDEIPALASPAAPPGPEAWTQRFIESWGLRLIGVSLVSIAFLLPSIALLLWQAVLSGSMLEVPTPTRIAGFACAAALLMISVPLLLLTACLTQLMRDFRHYCREAKPRDMAVRR